jgi:hypothetical protein
MNLRNPFKSLDNADSQRDRHKKQMHKEISSKALDIVKKVATHRCTNTDVDELAEMYKKYFKKYPDIDGEVRANNRIAKLRSII